MNRYRKVVYDASKFLEDSVLWDDEIKELEEKLEEIAELSAVNNSEVHTTEISQMTEKKTMQRLNIEAEINRRKYYKSLFHKVFYSLDPFDRRLLIGFHLMNKPKFIRTVMAERGCTNRTVYNLYNLAFDQYKIALRMGDNDDV